MAARRQNDKSRRLSSFAGNGKNTVRFVLYGQSRSRTRKGFMGRTSPPDRHRLRFLYRKVRDHSRPMARRYGKRSFAVPRRRQPSSRNGLMERLPVIHFKIERICRRARSFQASHRSRMGIRLQVRFRLRLLLGSRNGPCKLLVSE